MANSGSQAPGVRSRLTTVGHPVCAGRARPAYPRLRTAVVETEGTKEQAIRDEFGYSPTATTSFNQIIDRPEALAFDPMTVKQPAGSERQRRRVARKLGIQL